MTGPSHTPASGQPPAFDATQGETPNFTAEDSLPEQIALSSLKELRQVLGDLTPDQQSLAFAKALLLQSQSGLNLERDRYLESFERVKVLHSTITAFAHTLRDEDADPRAMFQKTASVFSGEKVLERTQEGFAANRVVNAFDAVFHMLAKRVAMISSLHQGVGIYAKRAQVLVTEAEQNIPLDQKVKVLEKLKNNQDAFLEMVGKLEQMLKGFPSFCRGLADRLKARHGEIVSQYGPEKVEKDESSGMGGLFDFFDQVAKPGRVPLYKENMYLTAFLHDLSDRIPTGVIKEEKEGEKTKLIRHPDVVPFISYLKAHADGHIYNAMQSKNIFEGISRALTEVGENLNSIYVVLKAANLIDYRRGDRGDVRAAYEVLVEDMESALTGEVTGSEAFQSFRQFRLKEVLDQVNSIESAPPDSKKVAEGSPKKSLSKREKTYLKLFEQLDKMVVDICEGKVGNPEIEKFLKEILPIKEELEGGRASASETLARDIDRGNYAFDITHGNMGDIELKRIPTSTLKYNDVIGASWTDVQDRLDTLRDYSQYPEFYHDMTIRGTLNSNMLVVGPYGCGKNMFLKALMADPRIVGINMTTDRIMSMWHSKSEENTRELFSLGEQKRRELDRPVVIGWDEFDSLFPKKGKDGSSYSSSDITSRMQKILQSVLCGDTVYEGVSLIALTNEPEQVPMAVWRRFAHVVVIQPLTESERKETMMHMMSGLPLIEDFQKKVDWDLFYKSTVDASGDVLGKVFDKVYRNVRDRILEDHGTAAMVELSGKVKAIRAEGKELSQEGRAKIFREVTKDKLLLTPDDLMRAWTSVLKEPDVIQAMKRQALFYHQIEDRFNDATMGDA